MAWKPDYLTVAQASAYLRVDDTADDAEVAGWVTAVSRAVDKYCNRQFGQEAAPVARTYRRTPFYDPTTGLWLLEIDDLMTTTGLLVNGVAYASSGAVLLPDNAAADGLPWERIGLASWPVPSYPAMPQSNVLTGRWGWSAVPANVPAACKIQIARLGARRDSPYGIAGSPDQGGQMRLLARLDVDAVNLLRGFTRRRTVG